MRGRRVVVTGLGMVSPLGLDVASSWAGILAGRSGINPITRFDASAFATRFAGTVEGFDVTTLMSAKDARKLDTFVHYGIAAADESVRDAGLDITPELAERTGVIVGSGIGGLPGIERGHNDYLKGGPRRISPFFVPGNIINMVAGNISIRHGLKGPNLAMATACASATHSIGDAARAVAYGDADVMLAGGAEMASSPMGIGGFGAARALSTRNDDPKGASRPWDRGRDGFVLGDGAAVLVVEAYEHACARGAHIYAEVLGYGMSADAFHMTLPESSGDGARRCMVNALRDAGVSGDQVQYVNAHGTSTPAGDVIETAALKAAFGDHARHLAVSSTKSMTGHLLGAAGGVEAVFTILAMRDRVAPPTINLDDPDPACDLDYVPHEARPLDIEYALSNSFGFGGTNGTLLFGRAP